EQLVLRGDGLTTTSLEILTGHEMTVRVRRQWRLAMTEAGGPADVDTYAGDSLVEHEDYETLARYDLAALPGEDVLVREVVLVSDHGVTYAAARVLAVVDRLPADVAHALATTHAPIGKLLVASGAQVVRELRRWGLVEARDLAPRLGPGVRPSSRVPARTYRMLDAGTRHPLTMITEWFAPRLFGTDGAF
nr:chorismate pyruvate-lyase family protein [Micromonospora sp. DSM 115978]